MLLQIPTIGVFMNLSFNKGTFTVVDNFEILMISIDHKGAARTFDTSEAASDYDRRLVQLGGGGLIIVSVDRATGNMTFETNVIVREYASAHKTMQKMIAGMSSYDDKKPTLYEMGVYKKDPPFKHLYYILTSTVGPALH
jgi:hypothetical protein